MSGGWNGHDGWGPVGAPGGNPDWASLADEHEREARRKRMLRIGAGVVGGLVVVAGVAAGVVVAGGGNGKEAAQSSVAGTASASATASTAASAAASPTAPEYSAATAGLVLGPAAQVDVQPGHTGPALMLTGHSDSFAEASATSLDTTHSFTVSAVVRNDAPADAKAAVSQGSGAFFSYYLGRDDSSPAARDRWVFKVQTAATTGKSVMALSKTQAATGMWTTLTGVYDAHAHTITLYVDGTAAATVRAPGMIASRTPVEIGRARYKSHWADAWDGAIADVRLWQQPFTPAEVATLARNGAAGVPQAAPARAVWLTQ